MFADFDNDGDPDVWIGRTILPSLYLVNDNGTFIDRSNQVDCTLPADASSLTAVDYDQDGLMDVLLSTYKDKGRYAVDEEMKADMKDELAGMNSGNQFLDKFGPSNKLFRNLGGGRFERVEKLPTGHLPKHAAGDVVPTLIKMATWICIMQTTMHRITFFGMMDLGSLSISRTMLGFDFKPIDGSDLGRLRR